MACFSRLAITVLLSASFVCGQKVEVAAIIARTEGPAADRDGNVYFTDRVSPRIFKLSPKGELTIFRDNANWPNGLLVDAQNRLIICEGGIADGSVAGIPGNPRMTRLDLKTGKLEILAKNFEGKPFNRPNDVTIDSKGRLYFTDLAAGSVYRIDGPGKVARILNQPDVTAPNGISISPDDKTLYLIESNTAPQGPRLVRAYDLAADGSVSNMRVHYDVLPGGADGMSIDRDGNLYLSVREGRKPGNTAAEPDVKNGVYVVSPAGKLLRFIAIEEEPITNNTFGGPDMKTLYVTAGKSVYKVQVDVPGLPR
jgi:gluconolactonase